MARPKSKLNNAKSKVIEDNILKENPDGMSGVIPKVVPVKVMPEMETVVFRNDRDPGVMHEFHYHSATHPLKHYKLYHGKEVTLPVEIIEHLENRKIPLYAYRPGPDGHPEMYINGYRYYFTCKRVRKAA